jgi:hypothetical protein
MTKNQLDVSKNQHKEFVRYHYNNSFIINHSNDMQLKHKEEFAICVQCRNPIEKCVCVCPFCGERDKCECALFDAATGG